jgi:hypothetical protein
MGSVPQNWIAEAVDCTFKGRGVSPSAAAQDFLVMATKDRESWHFVSETPISRNEFRFVYEVRRDEYSRTVFVNVKNILRVKET